MNHAFAKLAPLPCADRSRLRDFCCGFDALHRGSAGARIPQASGACRSRRTTARATPSTTFSGEAMAVDGYMATNTATFKADAPLLATPAGINVVTEDALDDQAAVTVRDALRGVAGVQATPSLNNYFGFNVRGFKTFDTYRNGMRADYSNFDLANVERIEVLKGPAGMLYGRMDPGGLINIVTKKPLETARTEISQEFGSFDHSKTIIDSTGPVTSDKTLLYRFVGSYTDSDSFRDFIETEHYQINPSVIWKPVAGTEIFLDFEVFNDDFRNDFGIPAVGRHPANIPIRPVTDRPERSHRQSKEYLHHDWAKPAADRGLDLEEPVHVSRRPLGWS
jgi:outer membrane receptor protein involved in Fe transport